MGTLVDAIARYEEQNAFAREVTLPEEDQARSTWPLERRLSLVSVTQCGVLQNTDVSRGLSTHPSRDRLGAFKNAMAPHPDI